MSSSAKWENPLTPPRVQGGFPSSISVLVSISSPLSSLSYIKAAMDLVQGAHGTGDSAFQGEAGLSQHGPLTQPWVSVPSLPCFASLACLPPSQALCLFLGPFPALPWRQALSGRSTPRDPRLKTPPSSHIGMTSDPALQAHRAPIPMRARASSEPLLCPAKPGLRHTRHVCRMEGQEACMFMFVPEAGRGGGRGEGPALCSLWLRKQKLEGPLSDLFTHQETGKLQGSDSPTPSTTAGGWRQAGPHARHHP